MISSVPALLCAVLLPSSITPGASLNGGLANGSLTNGSSRSSDPTSDEDCRRFRGSVGNGQGAQDCPSTWGEEQNLAWSVEVPGAAWSAPITLGDLVVVTTAISAEAPKPKGFTQGVADPRSFGAGGKQPQENVTFQVRAYELETGELRWVSTLASQRPPHPTHPSNTFATETPTTDGEHIFAGFGAIGLVVALDRDGQELWRKDIGTFPMTADFGTGSSLVEWMGLVYVISDNSEESFLLALDGESGEELWRVDRPAGSAWATPFVWENEEGAELVAAGPGAVSSYDPETGDLLWQLSGISGSFSCSPTFDARHVYLGNSGPGTRGPLLAVASGASGEFTLGQDIPEQVAWFKRGEGPGFSSPCVVGDHLYVVGSGGFLSCFDTETGDEIYKERLPNGTTIAASLWASDDAVFVLNEAGETFVISAGDTYEHLGTNKLDDLFWSTPAAAGDRLLLRGAERLYCVRAEAESSPADGADDN